MIPVLNEISACQSAPTQDTMEKFNQVLDYASMHPNATVQYHDDNMILMTDTDAAYHVLPAARSSISGHYYFTNHMVDYSKVNPPPNVPILI